MNEPGLAVASRQGQQPNQLADSQGGGGNLRVGQDYGRLAAQPRGLGAQTNEGPQQDPPVAEYDAPHERKIATGGGRATLTAASNKAVGK